MNAIKYPAWYARALALSQVKYWRRLKNGAEADMYYWFGEASTATANSPTYWAASGRAKAAAERWKAASVKASIATLDVRILADHQSDRRKRAARFARV